MCDELERFKATLSIAEVAQADFGYVIVKAKSSKASIVMRGSSGDEIIISRDKTDCHDVYFSRHDTNDNGSIIDFVKIRVGDNNPKVLYLVRKALRPWMPGAKTPKIKHTQVESVRPEAVQKDLAGVAARVSKMSSYSGTYLTEVRKLDPDVVSIFDVRQDERGNAIFVHQNSEGTVTGYEIKNAPSPGTNKAFTGFAAGGDKGLFITYLDDEQPPGVIVLTEAAIDALSYAQMKHSPGNLYISVAGTGTSAGQNTQIKELLAKHANLTLVLALDNDEPGDKFAEQVTAMAPAGMKITRPRPFGKDWNDDLKAWHAETAKRPKWVA